MIRLRRAHFAPLIGWILAQPVYGGCTLPPAPSKVPDGTTAAEADMLDAMQTLKRYNTDVNNYIKCLEFEAKQGRLARNEQERLHNSAVDGLKTVADRFNEQVRLFKARGS